MAVFTSPSAASRAAAASAGVRPVAVTTMRRARSTSFSLPADTSTIRFPKVRPRRTIDHGGDRVEHELLGRAGLQAGGAGDDLGADNDLDGVVGGAGDQRAGMAGQADGQRAGLAGGAEGAQHVGRAAAGADADDGVGRADAERQQLGGAGGGVVLGAFLRLA